MCEVALTTSSDEMYSCRNSTGPLQSSCKRMFHEVVWFETMMGVPRFSTITIHSNRSMDYCILTILCNGFHFSEKYVFVAYSLVV